MTNKKTKTSHWYNHWYWCLTIHTNHSQKPTLAQKSIDCRKFSRRYLNFKHSQKHFLWKVLTDTNIELRGLDWKDWTKSLHISTLQLSPILQASSTQSSSLPALQELGYKHYLYHKIHLIHQIVTTYWKLSANCITSFVTIRGEVIHILCQLTSFINWKNRSEFLGFQFIVKFLGRWSTTK